MTREVEVFQIFEVVDFLGGDLFFFFFFFFFLGGDLVFLLLL